MTCSSCCQATGSNRSLTHYDALQSELLTHPEIESVDYTNGTVFNCRTLGVPLDENFNQIIDAHMIYCTPEAFNIYGFKVISRNDNVQYGMWMTESFKKIFDNSQYLQQIMLDPSGDFGITGVIEDMSMYFLNNMSTTTTSPI